MLFAQVSRLLSTTVTTTVTTTMTGSSVSRKFSSEISKFLPRLIEPREHNIKSMCDQLQVDSVSTLVNQTVPPHIRLGESGLGGSSGSSLTKGGKTEPEVLKELERQLFTPGGRDHENFVGLGYYRSHLPTVIQRNVLESPLWYTAYTPYQAEISQGRLEALFNFQTLTSELAGLPVASAGLLDEGSAVSEGVSLLKRVHPEKNKVLVDVGVFDRTLMVLQTRAEQLGLVVEVVDVSTFNSSSNSSSGEHTVEEVVGVVMQFPDKYGRLRDYKEVTNHFGGRAVLAADILALNLYAPPGDFAVVCGSTQRLGIPLWMGGPSAAYFATKDEYVRKLPGRIVGLAPLVGTPGVVVASPSVVAEGLRLTLQTREQHIRMDKATSNICTSQALLAVVAGFYGVWHGKLGLRRVAEKVQKDTDVFVDAMGLPELKGRLWGTVGVRMPKERRAAGIQSILNSKHNIGVGVLSEDTLSVSFDETSNYDKIVKVADLLKMKLDHYSLYSNGTLHNKTDEMMKIRDKDTYMNQEVFNKYPTEHEMLRYITQLQNKDLSLAHSMITLGSCTMKLNPTTTLLPLSWPEVQDLHPFGPEARMTKYKEILNRLKSHLKEITRMDGCSLQPLSGAMGEYAGLLAIKKFQNDQKKKICLIPKSAHGTNAASAAMMNYQVMWIDDHTGEGIDVEKFRETCESVKEQLACLMITYPSTYGVFDERISELIDIVHANGGQVYMDGANMNAQLGITAPGHIGADVVHLNLHKTFAIPHGGGGPGMGPICVKKHLIPFLPDDEAPESGVVVSSSPYGQAGIGVIPYLFIEMLGGQGLTECGKFAVFNANYMMQKLKSHYPVKATNKHGRCSHEFIIQVSQFRQTTGVTEEDIAKRLMDYGFHAPTMSWPVPGSLMIEPTESESKEELDRFCEAMISIRKEIAMIETGQFDKTDNPLKNAPHTMETVVSDAWSRKYSREIAAFPLPWIRTRGKFWPSVSRISNVLGDKNLKLKLTK